MLDMENLHSQKLPQKPSNFKKTLKLCKASKTLKTLKEFRNFKTCNKPEKRLKLEKFPKKDKLVLGSEGPFEIMAICEL